MSGGTQRSQPATVCAMGSKEDFAAQIEGFEPLTDSSEIAPQQCHQRAGKRADLLSMQESVYGGSESISDCQASR